MKRRLEIARGLLHTPKILFLDEPTLGLDPQSRNQLWTQVKHLNETEGVTVFLTTHYMDEAERVAHRIAIIDHGRIVAQGSSAELKQQTEHRFARGGVPRADRIDDPRRTSRCRRADAPDGENVEDDEAVAIYILWLREVKRYLRSRAQIIASLGQPLLYLLVLGFGLGPVFRAGRAGQLPAVRRARASSGCRCSLPRSSLASGCSGIVSSGFSRRRSSRRCRGCRSWSAARSAAPRSR